MRDLIERKAVLALAKNVTLQNGAKHRCIDATQIYEIPSAQPSLTDDEWNLVKQLRSYHNGSYARMLDRLIAAAQIEIIHCRDCKHYYYADNRIPQKQRYTCDLDGDRWQPDSFCSFSERREDD